MNSIISICLLAKKYLVVAYYIKPHPKFNTEIPASEIPIITIRHAHIIIHPVKHQRARAPIFVVGGPAGGRGGLVLGGDIGEIGKGAVAGGGAGTGRRGRQGGARCVVKIPLGDKRVGIVWLFAIAGAHPAFCPVDRIP